VQVNDRLRKNTDAAMLVYIVEYCETSGALMHEEKLPTAKIEQRFKVYRDLKLAVETHQLDDAAGA